VKRRTFILAGLGAGGALVLGWSLMPPRQRLRGPRLTDLGDGALQLNGWVAIAPDDTVSIVMAKAEMGQGIHTAAAMLLAEELGCAWERVRTVQAPHDRIYVDLVTATESLWFRPDDQTWVARIARRMFRKTWREVGIMVTGGSSSVRDLWEPMRDAGAMARASLVNAAAARWEVGADDCRVEDGVVMHGDRRLRFGELVADAAKAPAREWRRKDPSHFAIIGRDRPRLDTPAKVNGTATFGIDVRVDGMRYAAMAMPPAFGATLEGYDDAAAKAVPGVVAVVPVRGGVAGAPGGVAVVATSTWQAKRGVDALAARWRPPPAPADADAVLRDLADVAARHEGKAFHHVGDVARALDAAATRVTAAYAVPYAAHVPMEPLNCTVRVADDGVDVWTGTQSASSAIKLVADLADVSAERVRLHVPFLGGGFGRRLEVDVIAQATEIALAMRGTPVQLLWSREQDLAHDVYRPATAAHVEGGVDANGRVTALRLTSAGDSPIIALMTRNRILGAGLAPDKSVIEGAYDQPYAFANARIAHERVDSPVPVGSWRSVGHGIQAFFVESFLDELAHAATRDPMDVRLELLAHDARATAVLRRAREASGWDAPLAPAADGARRGRGVAFHRAYEATVAMVAEVTVAADGAPRVDRVTCVVDCGLVVNPDGVRQQMESAVVFALSTVLGGAVPVREGRVQASNFGDYGLPRIAQAPAVETIIMPSAEAPGGIGEAGVPPVAPAVANAVFAATGERRRRLPLTG
jgi:isoquinoline 1-oxidoreductase beta subunit